MRRYTKSIIINIVTKDELLKIIYFWFKWQVI